MRRKSQKTNQRRVFSNPSIAQSRDKVNPERDPSEPCIINIASAPIRASYVGALARSSIPFEVKNTSEITFALAHLERVCYILGAMGDQMALVTLDAIRAGTIEVPR